MAILNITATDSTYVGTVYGKNADNSQSQDMLMGGWGDAYFDFLHIDITAGPSSASVSQVLLFLYVSSAVPKDPQSKVYRVTSSYLATATNLSQTSPTFNSTPYGTLPAPSATGWISVDVTQLYKDWKNGTFSNLGIRIAPNAIPTQTQSNGKYAAVPSANKPYFQVTYTPAVSSVGKWNFFTWK